ncbi:MAG TPA: ribonuclease [Sphingomicrobium sp.]|nr:ribonuclease [Sphingomicrobium sp.]
MPSPEWLVEHGIGETRAALVENGEIIQARIELDDIVRAGSVITARLANQGTTGRNAVAVSDKGDEYLLSRGAPGITEGARLTIEVTREEIPGGEPWKRPLARVTDKALAAMPPLAERLGGRKLVFPDARDLLSLAGWNELIDEARTGVVRFSGGELRVTPTPAMTLIDVDGYLPPDELAVVGASEATKAINRLDIGGPIGIDLPTSGSKAVRQLAAQAIDALLPQPFERTAVNGFGFAQVVRRRRGASLIELAQDRGLFEARALLRRAAFEPAGSKILVAHPAIVTHLEQRLKWIEGLSRQLGGSIRLRPDAALPIFGGYVQAA